MTVRCCHMLQPDRTLINPIDAVCSRPWGTWPEEPHPFRLQRNCTSPPVVMSELQRSFAKAKLAGLPLDPPLPHPASNILDADVEHGEPEDDDVEEEDDALKPLPDRRSADDDSSSASSASSASSTGTIRPSPKKHLFARPKGLVFSPCEQCYLLYECTRSIYFGHAL